MEGEKISHPPPLFWNTTKLEKNFGQNVGMTLFLRNTIISVAALLFKLLKTSGRQAVADASTGNSPKNVTGGGFCFQVGCATAHTPTHVGKSCWRWEMGKKEICRGEAGQGSCVCCRQSFYNRHPAPCLVFKKENPGLKFPPEHLCLCWIICVRPLLV